MSELTKEQLREIAAIRCDDAGRLAAFALAQVERAEADERELIERGKDIHTLTCALESERWRAEKAEAEIVNHESWLTTQQADTYAAEAERDRLRAQLDSILANSDSLESGRLADAHAENARLREEMESSNRQLENFSSGLSDALEQRDKAREELREAEEAIRLLSWERCEDCGGTGVVWAGPMDDPQQAQCERCWSEGLVPPPTDPFPIGQRMAHPAVRRARERGGRG